ncbi:vacuolar sorting protein [Naviculisporaceae sp. PSN 640]
MTPDISASLVSYLRHFITCCTRLVSDAGARESARLKNITSKHLALVSQALGFVATLTSYIREFLPRYYTTGLRLVESDEVKGLYQEHQNRIHDMLVDAMSGLVGSRAKALKNIDWDDGQKDVLPYMAALVKDTTSLRRILTKIVLEETVSMVLVPVSLSYKAQLGQAFQEISPMMEAGRDSLLLDVQCFECNLGRIVGFDDAGEYLTAIVRAQHVKIVALDAPSAAAEIEMEGTEESRKRQAKSGR